MRKLTTIILHIIDSDIPAHDNVETIRKWHVEERGFNDIGYHRYVNAKGKRFQGRPDEKIGAHTKGHNTGSIGIATFGKFGTERTQDQYVGIIQEIIAINLKYPSVKLVKQHSDFDPKKPHCAGFTQSQMDYFNQLIK